LNLPIYIARRYLFAKKSRNAINIISAISVGGVTIGTMALIIILSAFNGLDDLVRSLFNTFDPDLKISVVEGKTFSSEHENIRKLKDQEGILYLSEVIEENALLRYGEKQYIATIKGVSDDFVKMSGIDSMIYDGEFLLKDQKNSFAVVGQGIASNLSIGLSFITPIQIYVPKRTKNIILTPDKAFNRKYIFPSGFFAIQQDFDSRYVIVPIDFARDLFDYTVELSSIELKINPSYNPDRIQEELKILLGNEFEVKNRYEQQEFVYKIMQSEKWAIFLILSFILVIASFNIIGSLSMLIIEKKKDIETLRNLGANLQLIRKIFLLEGWMISVLGALSGLILGSIICIIQQQFGLIKIQGGESFVIDTYPVSMELTDFLFVFGTVLLIGYLAAWYPVRYISRKFMLAYR
jgi:lipoprotein-releasing system permease protein